MVYATSADSAVERVGLIETFSSRYRTADGVGVGSSGADVEAITGVRCSDFDGGQTQDCRHGYDMPPRYLGTKFSISFGTVRYVAITRP